MQLNTFDRLTLLNILPEAGDITLLRVVRDLTNALSFSEEEHASLGFKSDPASNQIQWDNTKDVAKDIEIGPVARALISKQLIDLSDKKKLPFAVLSLYDKFVPQEDGPKP